MSRARETAEPPGERRERRLPSRRGEPSGRRASRNAPTAGGHSAESAQQTLREGDERDDEQREGERVLERGRKRAVAADDALQQGQQESSGRHASDALHPREHDDAEGLQQEAAPE